MTAPGRNGGRVLISLSNATNNDPGAAAVRPGLKNIVEIGLGGMLHEAVRVFVARSGRICRSHLATS